MVILSFVIGCAAHGFNPVIVRFQNTPKQMRLMVRYVVGGVAILEMTDMAHNNRFTFQSQGRPENFKIEHLILKADKTPEEKLAESTAKANVFASQAKTEIEEFTDNGQFVAWTEKNQSSIEAMKKYPDAYKVLIAAVTVTTKRLTKEG